IVLKYFFAETGYTQAGQVKKLLIILLSFLSFPLFSQPYGNEWIEYSQKYYEIKITRPGVYRITASILTQAGINVSNVNIATVKIFGRGKEIPAYVVGDVNWSLEFYGEGNNGYLDSLV